MAKQQLTIVEAKKVISERLTAPKFSAQLKMALPKHLTPDRFVRCVFTQCNKNPKLLECTPDSIANSVLVGGEIGLEPNGRDGHLVPYWNGKKKCFEAQFITGYQGIIRLGYQSGMVKSFQAQAVYSRDIFNYKFGTGAMIEHIPCTDIDRGELVFAWAMAQLDNGGEPFVVLTPGDIKRRMSASQSADKEYSPWKSNTEAMWRKSAVRELAKWIPQSPRLERALMAENDAGEPLGMFDDDEDATSSENTIDGTAEPATDDAKKDESKKVAELEAKIAGKQLSPEELERQRSDREYEEYLKSQKK
jgi:recombination protein RecT